MNRMLGIVYIVVGLLLVLNALISGPKSIGSGAIGVVVIIMAGIVCTISGFWMLWRDRLGQKEKGDNESAGQSRQGTKKVTTKAPVKAGKE